jgi:hypothetical protein
VQLNLTSASASSAILRVDTSNTDSSTGRRSVRIESKAQYNRGLFIFDVIHTPHQCSTWPALWLTNRWNWPEDGEIDIMEAANTAESGNQVTLHTANSCTMRGVKRYQSGQVQGVNCWNGTRQNEGCGVRGPSSTFGPEFNQNEGGVYALELRSEGIRVWHFPRKAVPMDVASLMESNSNSGKVDPSKWHQPLADFPNTECSITSHFQNQSIIANIDLCGQWAGLDKYYSQESHCPDNCVQYVTEQPGSVYEGAYWEFGGWWVLEAISV